MGSRHARVTGKFLAELNDTKSFTKSLNCLFDKFVWISRIHHFSRPFIAAFIDENVPSALFRNIAKHPCFYSEIKHLPAFQFISDDKRTQRGSIWGGIAPIPEIWVSLKVFWVCLRWRISIFPLLNISFKLRAGQRVELQLNLSNLPPHLFSEEPLLIYRMQLLCILAHLPCFSPIFGKYILPSVPENS